MNRRDFLAAFAATTFFASKGHASAPFPVKFRQQPAWAPLMDLVPPASDEFAGEKVAMEIETGLRAALSRSATPIAAGCAGVSPAPVEYREIAPGVAKAVFGKDAAVAEGWTKWRASLGEIRDARFFSLPGDQLRYVIRSRNQGRLEYRVGYWKITWRNGAIASLEPVEEILTHADRPWFRDVTGHAFDGEPSFHDQLTRGVPYWRARLDPACGIDVYGENGVAAADIDGDGRDEIFVCQPGGLPNRLYKFDDSGRLRDISKQAGLDMLDDTAGALFADFRNSGRQDLVLIRTNQVLLFLNDGAGKFTPQPDAFRFATPPQGSFTSAAAADYDRDGRLDLYLCCYVYYQSEAQYRYPVPYHDARNGPPNFLFRNRLNESPGYFEDVTAATGMDHNNNRFSFAAAWCDYNNDGWPDVYVTNDFGSKNLYKNVNGHFRDVAEEAGVVDLGPGMSAAWLDYDGDGRPDLLVSNMWSACGQRVVNDPAFGPVAKDPSLKAKYQHHVKGNSLYHNNGDGTFGYTGDVEGIEICPWSWSCDGADFDNDGTPELYIATGMLTNNGKTDLMSYFYRQVVSKSPVKQSPAPEYENGWNAINQLVRQEHSWAGPEPNFFFVRKAGRYWDHSGVSGIDVPEDSRSFAFTDFDGDGNLDIVLKSRLGPQVRVFQNARGVDRNKIVIALRGVKSNRDAIGARVEAGGRTRWLAAGSAYLSQHTKRLYFGLGDETVARDVRVRWPSGDTQTFPPLKAGFLYEITEGVAEPKATPLRPRKDLPDNISFTVDNLARLHSTWFWEPVPLPEKRRGPALLYIHAGEPAPNIATPFDSLDLRKASDELAAGYAIFRRYLFDYRVDLQTPIWLLIDAESRARKIYAEPPSAAVAQADLHSLDGPLPDPRGVPLEGRFTGHPRRDYYKFGGALLMAGYNEQALPYLEEMLRRTPDNPKALFAVGRIHLQARRLNQARQALQRAVAIDPKLTGGWNELGGVEVEAGNLKEALSLYERALSIEPESIYILLNIGETQEKSGAAAEAERTYRHALELDPRSGDAANALGLLLAKQGHTAEARKLFETAISLKRDDSSAINNLGVLFLNIGQPNDAIAAFQYGIRMAPNDDALYLNLARVWVRLGNREKAKDVMRDLLERKPGHPVAQRALRELDTQP
ncbi:MAG: VCBS repeat-containing protein [Acidobacteria bacterium]|nr:VCBS repeat-containing protein [Acidobacteriota bacterium]